jgi:hypothetical protein
MDKLDKGVSSRNETVSGIRRLPLFRSIMFLYSAGRVMIRLGGHETIDAAQNDLAAKGVPDRVVDLLQLTTRPQILNWFRAMYLVGPDIIAEIEGLLNEVFKKGFDIGVKQQKLVATQPPPIPPYRGGSR